MFTVPADDDAAGPWPIFNRLLASSADLAVLREMLDSDLRLAIMMRAGDWSRGEKVKLGMCCLPSVQGELRPLFEQLLEDTLGYYPDFLIVLNAEWWEDASEVEREALVFHEALHADHAKDKYGTPRFNRDTGLPIPAIRQHSIEEFNEVVRRYGRWKSDVGDFLDAAAEYDPNSAENANNVDVAEPMF